MGQISSRMETRRTELVEDSLERVRSCLERLGMDEQQAAQFAIRVVDDLVDAWGGQMICFPTSYKRKLLQREEAVYSRFNGNNYAELSHEYGMGERGIRKLIARVRQRKLAEKAA